MIDENRNEVTPIALPVIDSPMVHPPVETHDRPVTRAYARHHNISIPLINEEQPNRRSTGPTPRGVDSTPAEPVVLGPAVSSRGAARPQAEKKKGIHWWGLN